MSKSYFTQEIDAVLNEFSVESEMGLSKAAAQKRLAQYGPNALKEKEARGIFSLIFDQLKEMMVVILLVAALVSFLMHEHIEAIVILVIVVLNTLLGFWQEFNAEKAMDALNKMAEPNARVLRDGQEMTLPAKELVPGDIIIIESGNLIPADARIIESANLKVQESALTGESEPVEKNADVLSDEKVSLADRKNMLYMGTIVTYGRGEAVVVATGMQTELGNIANLLQDVVDEKTPLQKRLAKLGVKIAFFALFLIGIVAALSYFRGLGLKEIFMTAISIAVAAIPEGLPAVVTIALALGARRMLKRKALIRNLPAVETLGSVTVICSDKTGTLTKNEMTVTDVLLVDNQFSIEEIAQSPDANPTIQLALLSGALCNDAVLEEVNKDQEGSLSAIGDPTEGSLVVAAHKSGMMKDEIEEALKRVQEFPFDSHRKRMSTLHEISSVPTELKPALDLAMQASQEQHILFTKGSVDGLMDICTQAIVDNNIVDMSDQIKTDILNMNTEKASNGIRVLGMAYRMINIDQVKDVKEEEKDLVFVGLSCMIDPVRPEAIEAVSMCKKAGVRVVMITGDHPLTAQAIGKELGLAENEKFLTGQQLAEMNEAELKECINHTSIFARVSPEHKMVIIDALQENNEIVSMTGDGVNDAPALKSADIGVAMGITGTDVSKEASDMVLLDDNFATIVSAVKEGRTIFDNIRKFVKYILTGNLGEIMVMLVGPILGMPLPLLPIQILWINLVTDGAPAVALGYEESEKDIMDRPPFEPNEGVFSRGIGSQILIIGSITGLLSIAIGYIFWKIDPASKVWQTMVFSIIAFCQIALAMCIRKTKETLFSRSFFTNMPMLLAVGLTFVLQMIIVYVPFFNTIFKTTPLNLFQLVVCMGAGLLIVIIVEVQKAFLRRKTGDRHLRP